VSGLLGLAAIGWVPPGSALAAALSRSLVELLWQGALAALALAAALRFLRRASPEARYAVSVLALALVAALPVAGVAVELADRAAAREHAPGSPPAAVPDSSEASTRVETGAGGPAAEVVRTLRTCMQALRLTLALPETVLPWVLPLWLAGVAILAVAHLGGWRRLRLLRRAAAPVADPRWREALARLARRLGVRRRVALLAAAVDGPAVVGWLRPAILVPAGMLLAVPPAHLEALLAHELAHVRRWDFAVNLLQAAVETLLFYHPAVWWISRQVRLEREACCDRAAAVACGGRAPYARALAELEERRRRPFRLAPALGASDLPERMRRLAGAPPRLGAGPALLVAPLVLGLALVALAPALPGSATATERVGEELVSSRGGEGQRSSGGDELRPYTTPGLRARARALELVPESPAAETPGPATPAEPAAPELFAAYGVSEDFAAEMSAALDPEPSPEELVLLRRYGVTPALARELTTALAEAGAPQPDPDTLATLRRYDVTPDWVRAYVALGYRSLSADELITLRRYDVTPEYAREVARAGYPSLPPHELVSLRRYGVTAERLRELAAQLRKPPVAEVIAGARRPPVRRFAS
jgi:beta-lactamase regulating signal transducer with metallopeptidase domain